MVAHWAKASTNHPEWNLSQDLYLEYFYPFVYFLKGSFAWLNSIHCKNEPWLITDQINFVVNNFVLNQVTEGLCEACCVAMVWRWALCLQLTFPRECCGKTYSTEGWWVRHRNTSHSRKSHKTSSKYRYECHLCEVVYSLAHQLRNHYRAYHPEVNLKENRIIILPSGEAAPPAPLIPENLPKGTKIPLPVLPKSKPTTESICSYQCQLCRANFTKRTHLQQHLKETHNISNVSDMMSLSTGSDTVLPHTAGDDVPKDQPPYSIPQLPADKDSGLQRGDVRMPATTGTLFTPGSRLLIPMPDGNTVPLEIISSMNPMVGLPKEVPSKSDSQQAQRRGGPPENIISPSPRASLSSEASSEPAPYIRKRGRPRGAKTRNKIRMVPQYSRSKYNTLGQSQSPPFVIAPISTPEEEMAREAESRSKEEETETSTNLPSESASESELKSAAKSDSLLTGTESDLDVPVGDIKLVHLAEHMLSTSFKSEDTIL